MPEQGQPSMIAADIVESNPSAAAAAAPAAAAARVSLEPPLAPRRNKRPAQPELSPKRARTDTSSMQALDPIGMRRRGRTHVQSRVVPALRRRSSSDHQQENAVVGRGDGNSNENNRHITHRNEANAAAAPRVALAARNEASTVSPTKSVDEIEQEVRGLLDDKLFGKDVAVKADALRQLKVYLQTSESSEEEHQQMKEYSRAVSNLGGCHLVLIALRQEIDKDGGPNRGVALAAVKFLQNWNFRLERRDTMSRFNGVGKIVRAMEAFPDDVELQSAAITCLHNFTYDADASRRQELLEENCLRLIVHAATPSTTCGKTKVRAMLILQRLRTIGGRSHVKRLIRSGALVAVARTYSDHTTYGAPQCQVCEVSRRLMSKLHG
jgi:hypothetical protein